VLHELIDLDPVDGRGPGPPGRPGLAQDGVEDLVGGLMDADRPQEADQRRLADRGAGDGARQQLTSSAVRRLKATRRVEFWIGWPWVTPNRDVAVFHTAVDESPADGSPATVEVTRTVAPVSGLIRLGLKEETPVPRSADERCSSSEL
jgi:hypothetical protein